MNGPFSDIDVLSWPPEIRQMRAVLGGREKVYLSGKTEGPEPGSIVSSIRVSKVDGSFRVTAYYQIDRADNFTQELAWHSYRLCDISFIEFNTVEKGGAR